MSAADKFPSRVASATSNPNNCPWGFSGIDAITRDSKAGFVLQSFSGPGQAYSFQELRVFEHYSSNTMVPVCTPAPDSTFVDTIAGVRSWFFDELIDSIAVSFDAPQEADVQYTLQGIQMVRPESGLIYHALGVNGAATKSFLRSENFIEQGAYVAPDLVIFGSMVSKTLTSEPSTSNETKSKYATPTARSSCPNGADGTW